MSFGWGKTMRLSAIMFLVLITLPITADVREMIVSSEWLATNINRVVVVDVGDRAAYVGGHVPGARWLDAAQLVTQRDGTPNELPMIPTLEALFTRLGLGDRERIVIYSRDPILATRAWFTLDYLGHGRRAAILDGGFAKWSDEKRPVTAEATIVEPGAFHARANSGALTNFKTMRELVRFYDILAGDIVLIDARSPIQYRGTEAGAEVRRAGHIPGAQNVPWNENLTAGPIARLLPERELREIYTTAGVRPRSTNVVYCRTGMQATVNYFVLRYLGYEATLFDGSFVEWSADLSTIVVEVKDPAPKNVGESTTAKAPTR